MTMKLLIKSDNDNRTFNKKWQWQLRVFVKKITLNNTIIKSDNGGLDKKVTMTIEILVNPPKNILGDKNLKSDNDDGQKLKKWQWQ